MPHPQLWSALLLVGGPLSFAGLACAQPGQQAPRPAPASNVSPSGAEAKPEDAVAKRIYAVRLELAQSEAVIRVALESARKARQDAQASGTAPGRLKQLDDLIAQIHDMQDRATRRESVFDSLAATSLKLRPTAIRQPVTRGLDVDPWEQVQELTSQSEADAAQATALAKIAAPPPPQVTAQRDSQNGGGTAGPAPQSLADLEAAWFRQLHQGLLQYKVPTNMFWKEPATVTVSVLGPQAPPSSGLADATGSGSLKVSDRMKVVITCPDNPDEFTIERQTGTDDVQFVPINGSTTWNWTVTPKYTGRSQKVLISAWVLYPGEDDKILQELPAYTAQIDVHVPGLGESLKRLIEGDPDYWLKYGLPGGAGFVFLSGALEGLRRWLKKRKSKGGAKPTPA